MGSRSAGDEDRFELRGELGAGGSSAVYRVFDRARGVEVALKTLRRAGGSDLYRFKREFRAMAGLSHPNLATLHELYAVGHEWMYTMELVEGVPFDRWVRPTPRVGDDHRDPAADADTEVAATETVAAAARARTDARGGRLDEARLRDALYQLADALTAVHALGKVHRDLKPTNVLVEDDGRVVLLDFGLIAEPGSLDHTHEHSAVGTVAYMAPEQAADLPLTPASDWYALGAMLYEALTGQRPFRGSPPEVLMRKQREDPPLPSAVAAGVPGDLERLCVRLMDRDPERRPDGHTVLAALGCAPSRATRELEARARRQQAAPPPPVALTGLRTALADSRDHFVVVLVRGRAATGKSALVEAFLDEARAEHGALTLTGSDGRREQVPLPGLDQALDQLSTYLLGLPRDEAAALLADAAPLARLFPALRRIPALQAPLLPQATPIGPDELRRRGLAALRRLLVRLGDARPVVLAFEHTGQTRGADARSFTECFIGPDMPCVLVVVVARPDVVEHSESIADLRRWAAQLGGDLRVVDLDAPAPSR
ncbi:MAG TPA: serine/threonine-protein kinase [Kofleriaceae bacterium]|nr:serine/threonine-protein kinase [Kofleriaceae bacterium]